MIHIKLTQHTIFRIHFVTLSEVEEHYQYLFQQIIR
jgi:hypothetical protein